MSRYMEKIDDIMEALLGESVDEYGEKYSQVYCYEIKGMEKDFYEYVELFKKLPFVLTAEDIVRLLVIVEFDHIGHTRYSNDMDYMKLKEIAKYLLDNK